jgi:hypothetical protein
MEIVTIVCDLFVVVVNFIRIYQNDYDNILKPLILLTLCSFTLGGVICGKIVNRK